MEKIAILQVGTPQNFEIPVGGSPKIQMRTSPLTFGIALNKLRSYIPK